MLNTDVAVGVRGILTSAIPLAVAIGVFGVVYGAAADSLLGAQLAIASSLLIFSGTLQFATLSLIDAGAGPIAILVTAAALNLRHLVLGAAIRPRITGGLGRRAALGWFLIDESFGLAVAARRQAGLVLGVAGVTFYLAWLIGTVLGLAGARLASLEGLATALFPVLFIGLAALTARSRSGAVRAIGAALLVAVLILLLPQVRAFAPIVAALTVAAISIGGRAGLRHRP